MEGKIVMKRLRYLLLEIQENKARETCSWEGKRYQKFKF